MMFTSAEELASKGKLANAVLMEQWITTRDTLPLLEAGYDVC